MNVAGRPSAFRFRQPLLFFHPTRYDRTLHAVHAAEVLRIASCRFSSLPILPCDAFASYTRFIMTFARPVLSITFHHINL
jgi:hypothetical protein